MAAEMVDGVMAPRSQEQRTNGLTGTYPADWPDIAKRIKDAANWHCVRCRHPHAPELHYTLTVHHLDMDKTNCADWNLAALCQRCHLSIQGRVDFHQFYMLEHSPWMAPYVRGFEDNLGITRGKGGG